MAFDARLVDWLTDLRDLNSLFLTYLRERARDGQACLGLTRTVVRRLLNADPVALDRVAELPTALFYLNIDRARGSRTFGVPTCPTEQMRFSLALQLLSSARNIARSHAFEARMFLHLSAAGVKQLRTLPLSQLPVLANSPDVMSCALTHGGLTWPALIRDDDPEAVRMLILIALQPALRSAYSPSSRPANQRRASFG
jgi:hypothetical protein